MSDYIKASGLTPSDFSKMTARVKGCYSRLVGLPWPTSLRIVNTVHSPMDAAFKVTFHTEDGKQALHLYYSPHSGEVRLDKQEQWEALSRHQNEVRRKEIQQDAWVHTDGVDYRYVVLTFPNGEKHTFKEGPGPCGRTVLQLKVQVSNGIIIVKQLCDDYTQPDLFHYPQENLRNWTFYKTNDPNPGKGGLPALEVPACG